MTESSQLRILVADDHDLLRDMLQLYLGKEPDISVETVADFNAAFERVKEEPVFDLVLLDYSMPGMTGLEGQAHQSIRSGARLAWRRAAVPVRASGRVCGTGRSGTPYAND